MPLSDPVTYDEASFAFHDLESLANVFTFGVWTPRLKRVDLFYLVDADGSALDREVNGRGLGKAGAAQAIAGSNPALVEAVRGNPAALFLHDLRTWGAVDLMASIVGASTARFVTNPSSPSIYGDRWRPVCDTDPGFDPCGAHPYLCGYNSSKYDTTMLSIFLVLALKHVPAAIKASQPLSTGFTPVSAAEMRRHNDMLFTPDLIDFMPRYLTQAALGGPTGWDSHANLVRNAMIASGRHVDTSLFNEVQRKVALKRHLGGLGRQIKKSDKLGSHAARVETLAEFLDLLAYNVSDLVGLWHLSQHPTYASAFDLKNGLLNEYPETIYDRDGAAYRPGIRPGNIRKDRLTVDATSAKFVARILAPYSNLVDLPAVSFDYPAQEVVDELAAQGIHIERRNVLEDSLDFFKKTVHCKNALAQFMEVYEYYASIQGKNFNDSPEWLEAHGVKSAAQAADNVRHGNASWENGQKGYPEGLQPWASLKDIPKRPLNIPYFLQDGTPTTCFATFSTGGIHGAEADHDAFEADLAAWREREELMDAVKAAYLDPLELRTRRKVEVAMPDGSVREVEWKEVLTSKTTIKALKARAEELAALGEDPSPEQVAEVEERYAGVGFKPLPKKPELFEPTPDGSNKLKAKYTFTSAGRVIHEDFTSYYPNMLRNMRAFYNPELGADRYAKILGDKDRYGKMMEEPGTASEQRERLTVLRNGTKLILNSASGAGDTTFANQPIRVNNAIISMRIIGQLFSWRIGQAQTLAGAKIVSTNTDGLYSQLDEETNNRVLREQQAQINVEIEPEPMVIVSKDSNNRLEIGQLSGRALAKMDPAEAERIKTKIDADVWDLETTTIQGASGGTLACWKGPRPDKSLAHPAVQDYALAHYLRRIAVGWTPDWREAPLSMAELLDRRLGRQLLEQALAEEPVLALRLFQNVIAASSGKITIPYAIDPADPVDGQGLPKVITMQHYNRVFYVRPGTPGTVSLMAAGAWAVPPASKTTRARNGDRPVVDEREATIVLRANGFSRAKEPGFTQLPADQDVSSRRLTGINPEWSCLVVNDDLHHLAPKRVAELLSSLDLDVYLDQLAKVFEANWMNSGGPREASGGEPSPAPEPEEG